MGPRTRRGSAVANAGLLLAYEESGYDNTRPGRLPDLLPHWSVRRLKEAGADCVKVLIYYAPGDAPEVNRGEARVHRAHRRRVPHERHSRSSSSSSATTTREANEKGPEFAKRKPAVVAGSMAEFSKDRYGVDVMKVEIPVNMKFVEGTRAASRATKVCTKQEAIRRLPAGRGRGAASPSSTCRPGSATRSSPSRWSWRPNRASSSPAFSAVGLPGRTAFRSTPPRAAMRSGSGSGRRACATSATSTTRCGGRRRGSGPTGSNRPACTPRTLRRRTQRSDSAAAQGHGAGPMGQNAEPASRFGAPAPPGPGTGNSPLAVGVDVLHRYRPEVLEGPRGPRRPADRRPRAPELVHEFVNDLYRFELRRLRARQVRWGHPKAVNTRATSSRCASGTCWYPCR